jgi:lipopolysaccharide biosynthesis glycosyltransferase
VLASVDRLVVLPADAVVLGDVAELADLDLQGNLLAAPTVVGDRASSGFVLIHAASGRLRAKTHASAELRRRAYARHAFDFDAFDADVLVIDAAEYRRRQMVSIYVPLIEEFGLTYRELLHFEVGPHRAVVDPAWHVVPSRSPLERASLLHWADQAKPWTDDLAPAEQVWIDASA